MDTGFLARMTAGPLTVATGLDQPTASLEVWPNPSQHGTVWVLGPPPGQRVQVLDALGRKVSIGQMPATGPLALALPAALPAGVYVVRSATQVRRLVIE